MLSCNSRDIKEQNDGGGDITVKKIWNGITSVIIGLIILVAVLVYGVRIFGIQPFVVLSGSMEPTYHTGSLIYVQKIDTDKLETGDAITFQLTGGGVATHRIVEIVGEADDLCFRTKGDANDTVDGSLVPAENVVGRVVFSCPYLGYVVKFIQSPSGRYTAIAGGACLLLLLILPELLFSDDTEKKKEE